MPLSENIRKLIAATLFCVFTTSAFAQISHGGQPLPLNMELRTRTVTPKTDFFVEMPAFNVQEARLQSEQEKARFKSLEFAHKFHVFLRPDNSGTRFIWGDMNVWRVGIRSKDALSLNILFSKFRLPQGAKVFVYNADQSEILGSYTQENNTDLNLLPIQPILGEELIVEYQEPINAAFKGDIEIGEVNHDFRGILRATEPRDPIQSCHPNIVCYPEDIQPGSGVVALIINGTTYCTGSLINNSANDGTPYIITATHCLNRDYNINFLSNRQYDVVAGKTVVFFGYQAPVCGREGSGNTYRDIRGPVQMSIASLDSVLILEKHDISLLKLKNVSIPPKEFQPYYLGWNISSRPRPSFHGIHHPNGGIKKVAVDENMISITSFGTSSPYNMSPNVHWNVENWEEGSTEKGSSGSPLLDKDKRTIGTLSGGNSYCNKKNPDQYAALFKAWHVTENHGEGGLSNPHSLKYYLDPGSSQFQQINGLNPFLNQPYAKSSNYTITDTVVQSYHNSVPMFATNNTFGYTEFAEEFNTLKPTKLEGVFVTSPITNSVLNLNVKIKIHADNNGSPGIVLHEVPLNYSFRYYQAGNFNETHRDMMNNVENYIKLSTPVDVSGKFFISYTDINNVPNGFSLLNVRPRKTGSGRASTAWMKNASGWVKSSESIENPINTSFLIAPYVIGTGLTPPNDPQEDETTIKTYYNGAVNRIFIESNKDLISWEIFYVSGQKVFEGKAESSIRRISFPVGHLAKGIYVVKISANGASKNVKVPVR